MKAKLLTDIRKYLIEENIYTAKDEITLLLLETTYSQYVNAVKEVKASGQTIQQTDPRTGRMRTVTNPAFRNQLELQKELYKLIDALYLTPKSRKTKKETNEEKDNPFANLIKSIGEVEKR